MRINRNFGKYENGEITYAKTWIDTGRGIKMNPTDADYIALGYKRIVDVRPETDTEHCAIAVGWKETETEIMRDYEERDAVKPPRRFSKLKAVIALTEAGLWAKVKAYIEAAGLYDLYLAANEFMEDDPYFVKGLTELKAQLGVDDALIEKILVKSEATI